MTRNIFFAVQILNKLKQAFAFYLCSHLVKMRIQIANEEKNIFHFEKKNPHVNLFYKCPNEIT